ncbi:elongation factor-like GTPase 1 isoform X1 [Hydractinia symbiolongicarpus]|uniref:elongation factor-like GTPase 1 isoform X1 n=2 Tax=Hydractinia symbiolongicarpus TaxID=13093 RepID=UPI00254F1D4B|nr:elongation factor-like GTPase 1 isoform X1 [Hydractinia symbiolongicarpus]
MKTESIEFISSLQKNTSHIRNICILAHVDHGKTTLADCLIASNGIISSRLAGKLRYMDSREDEQKRGITMKSSAISLFYNLDLKNYLINLIDSPGHIDFSSEVSTAVRLCDGALVVVDVVEGVCPQTNAVLRQAWLEGIKPCLVLNKVDRLITELRMSPIEAYYHLQKIMEQVNAVTGNLFSAQVMEQSTKDENKENITLNEGESQVFDWSSGLDEADDENIYFSPAQGNVVFASAIDGWAFGIDTFAKLYSEKLGISSNILLKTLWGDYFLNLKAKKIFKGAHVKGKKPLFVQFILQNIWDVYEAVLLNRDKEKIDKIVASLKLKISARDSKYTDYRIHLHAILRQWLPLSDALLGMVCKVLPSPLDIKEERVKNLMCSGFKKFESFSFETQQLKSDFLKCSSADEAPVIVFVSKMLSVPTSVLPHNRARPLTKEELTARHEAVKQRIAERETHNENSTGDDVEQLTNTNAADTSEEATPTEEATKDGETFIAFARIFSGTLKKGSSLYVLGPKYDPSIELEEVSSMTNGENANDLGNQLLDKHMSRCTIEDLYLMMGREFELFDEVPAGNILGINGLGDHVLKSATVSTSLACPPFTPMHLEAMPIVRVAVEPKQPSQLPFLISGMKLLNQADPCVQVLLQESGEYIIVAAGEVHLQRCLDDLRQRYAKIQIRVSDPIVPFRETIVAPPKVDMVNEEITEENKVTAHYTQRLPAFMLKEINVFSDTIHKGGELATVSQDDGEQANADGGTERLTKTQLSELRKSNKIKEKLGLIEALTSNKQYCICLHAKPIPRDVIGCLESNAHLLKILQKIANENSADEKQKLLNNLTSTTRNEIQKFYDNLKTLFAASGKLWKGAADKIWSMGPKGTNNNLLLNNIKDYNRTNIWQGIINSSNADNTLREFDNSIVSGFQVAVQAGPMCEEPMMGVAFFVEEWNILEKVSSDETYAPLSGQYISAVREGCRCAVMAQPMRLMAAMYSCEIQATSDVLGKMYGVLGKREGKILSEDLKEGSDIFQINAELPVAESFGFAEEIRKKTSGLASPQLVFNRWEVIDVDPFWIPITEEEYELYGEKADSENLALKYVNSVRKRKGLYIEKKTVEFAEKQRTLKKNK